MTHGYWSNFCDFFSVLSDLYNFNPIAVEKQTNKQTPVKTQKTSKQTTKNKQPPKLPKKKNHQSKANQDKLIIYLRSTLKLMKLLMKRNFMAVLLIVWCDLRVENQTD